MTSRPMWLLLLACVLTVTATPAAGSAPKPTTTHRAASAAHRASPATSRPAPLAAPHAPAAARTLDDIHIEGEIPVPQVLFITARDQRRFMEFQHRRYLKSGRQLGEASSLPDRIVVTPSRPTPEKETSR